MSLVLVLVAFALLKNGVAIENVQQSLVYDLSHTLTADIPKIPGSRSFEKKSSIKEFGSADESICLGTHLGTHLDAPCDFCKDGTKWCIDEITVDRLTSRPVALVDVRDKIFRGERIIDSEASLTSNDLLEWENRNGIIERGSVLLILTGWSRFWDREDLYRGINETTGKMEFPGISKEAADWLIENRDVYGLGVDTLSVDNGRTTQFEVHRALCRKNIYNLENLVNLHLLPPVGAILNVGLPKLGGGATGAPVRVTAEVFCRRKSTSDAESKASATTLFFICSSIIFLAERSF